ncbi:MAG: TrkH family potassium uptake protein [Woeseiaceae bacterium]|nr:TrkH family potassium uptake protein [Woeseiaceae bacterium]
MIAFPFVGFLLGVITLGIALLLLAPCIVAWQLGSQDLQAFLISDAVAAGVGFALVFLNRKAEHKLNIREVFLLTALSWLSACLFGALPFVLSHTVSDFTDAIFESVSGVTTTGATVLTHLDTLPKDILLWRSMMQWVGGLGIVALGAAVLPFLGIGGMKLFRAESSDFSEKLLPQTRKFLMQLLLLYVAISALCVIAYTFAGMSIFDAVNHAMTTVSTGGFSTHDSSIAFFNSRAVEAVAIFFMLAAAAPFVIYLPLLSGQPAKFAPDSQVWTMLQFFTVVTALLVVWLTVTGQSGILAAVRAALFNVVSIGTTTGYVSAEYTAWGYLAVIVFFFLTFVGGCSGSTSGGIKIFRFKIAYIMFKETIQRLLHPNAVFARSVDGKPLTDDTAASVAAFALAFASTVGIVAILLAAVGNDFATSFSAAATATANVGPGIGPVIGPVSNFASLSDPSKSILCVAMLLGRLEIFTFLILLTPLFWRH